MQCTCIQLSLFIVFSILSEWCALGMVTCIAVLAVEDMYMWPLLIWYILTFYYNFASLPCVNHSYAFGSVNMFFFSCLFFF